MWQTTQALALGNEEAWEGHPQCGGGKGSMKLPDKNPSQLLYSHRASLPVLHSSLLLWLSESSYYTFHGA